MAGLTDMEELSGTVADPGIADYVREALTCYSVGAFRACIVLTCNALFEDLRQKVRILSGVSSDAKKISDDIEILAADQKPFESTLVDRLNSKSIISTLQAQRLKQLIDHRNKAAHPSGLHASAEEARFVFFEAIDKFLSAPILSANMQVDLLLQRLVGANYFPDRSLINIKTVVADELEQIHSLAYPYLLLKVVALCKSAVPDVKRNAENFIVGMASQRKADIRTVLDKHFIVKEAHDLSLWQTLTATLAADPQLLANNDAATKLRLGKLLVHTVTSTEDSLPVTTLRHPLYLLRQMTAKLGEPELMTFWEFAEASVETYWHNPDIVKSMEKSTPVRAKILETLLSKAGSSQYDTANRFARGLPDYEAELASILTDDEALRVLAAVQQAGIWGAWGAKALQSSYYERVPSLKKKAKECCIQDGAAALALVEEYSGADYSELYSHLVATPV